MVTSGVSNTFTNTCPIIQTKVNSASGQGVVSRDCVSKIYASEKIGRLLFSNE
jgi:hypothetical protein